MTPRRKFALVLVLTGVYVASVLLAAYALRPRWIGQGDSANCARAANVSLGDAAEAVARREGANLWDRPAYVAPVFVNATGALFTLDCGEGIVPSPMGVRLPTGTPDGEDHATWRVILPGYGDALPPFYHQTYLDWDTGACVFRYGGC